MTARYTTGELLKLAKDEGPLALSNLQQAVVWAAQTLEAADAAVKAEYERACWEKSRADAQPVKQATTTSGHCQHHKGPRGCQLHNLQCGYPACDIKTKEAKP